MKIMKIITVCIMAVASILTSNIEDLPELEAEFGSIKDIQAVSKK